MKKQLLIAALSATMSLTAVANVTISGEASFKYKNKSTYSEHHIKDTSNTFSDDYKLVFTGTAGDTTAVIEIEKGEAKQSTVTTTDETTSSVITDAGAFRIADAYIETKLGAVDLKVGSFKPGTLGVTANVLDLTQEKKTAIASVEMDNITVKAGFASETQVTKGDDTDYNVDGKVLAAVTGSFSDWTVGLGLFGDNKALSVAGDVSGWGVTFEHAKKAAGDKVNFLQVTKDFNSVTFGLAISRGENLAEGPWALGEVEDSISNLQLSADMKMKGNDLSVKVGKLGYKNKVNKARNYIKFGLSRDLASGATLSVSYLNAGTEVAADAKQKNDNTLEAKLSVDF